MDAATHTHSALSWIVYDGRRKIFRRTSDPITIIEQLALCPTATPARLMKPGEMVSRASREQKRALATLTSDDIANVRLPDWA